MIAESDLLKSLQWRYATKSFDPHKRIADSTWQTLRESIRLTPSSYGLQPWKFVVVSDRAVRAELKPFAWGQSQITDASHLIVFCAKKDVSVEHIDEYLTAAAKARGVPVESLTAYREMMVGDVVHGPRSAVVNEWAARQVYIALGNAMTAAAVLQIDSCPIEGFQPAEFDRILQLPQRRLASTVVLALGYRAHDDHSAKHPKVRYPVNQVFLDI